MARHTPRSGAALLAVAAAMIFGVSACGDSGTDPASDTTPTSATTTPTAPTTSTAPDDGENEPPPVKLTNGVYTAPDGSYSFRADPKWESADAGVQLAFATNAARTQTLSVLPDTLEGAPADLEDYVDVSIESAPQELPGFKLASRRSITLPSGDQAVRIESTATVDGAPYRLLSIITVSDQAAVTMFYASPPELFAAGVKVVEPYMQSVDVR